MSETGDEKSHSTEHTIEIGVLTTLGILGAIGAAVAYRHNHRHDHEEPQLPPHEQ